MDVIDREAARKRGLKRFYTGRKCRRCGTKDQCYVSTGNCVECNRRSTQEWRERNRQRTRDYSKEYHRTHYEEKREQIIAAVKRYAEKNYAKISGRNARRYLEDIEKNRQTRREYAANNKASSRARLQRWRADNPDQNKRLSNGYRARKRDAPGQYSVADIAAMKRAQRGICAGPGCDADITKKHTVDHKIPLIRGGSNDPSNLQLLCGPCNASKSDRTMEEWRGRHIRKRPPPAPPGI